MKAKALIPLMLALVLGVLTFVIGRRVLAKQVAPPQQAGAQVLVAVAALPAGHLLAEGDVRLAETPIESLSATMFTKPADLKGRVLATAVEAGQVIRQSLLAPEGTASALQAKVPAGMRAVTIAVNEFSGLAGLISPGVKVDLIATLVDNVTGETFARTIVQNVEVSAVGRDLDPGSEANAKPDPRTAQRISKTVTLLVTSTQAAAIDLAFSKSKPRLVLRSSDDDATVDDGGVTLAELSGRAEQDRMAATTKDDSDSKLMEMLATMQKQIQDVSQASQDMARQAAQGMERSANGSQLTPEAAEAQQALLHSVRVFRGGAESREQFDEQGRAAGEVGKAGERPSGNAPGNAAANPPANAPAKPAAATGREKQQVKAPAPNAADGAGARAAANE